MMQCMLGNLAPYRQLWRCLFPISMQIPQKMCYGAREGMTNMLITAEQLRAALVHENYLVFDCRFTLADPHYGRNVYLQSHIPGAWYLDLEQDLAGPVEAHGGRHPLPEVDELAAKLAAAGLSTDAKVVVYDDDGSMAPRAWWLIRYLGHEHVSLLDGGWPAWVAAGGATTSDLPSPHSGGFVPKVQHDWVASVQEVEQMVQGERPGVLVDARAPGRFRGEVEPIDPVAGHIPGARNVVWQEHMDSSGHWHTPDVIQSRFTSVIKQVADDRQVVVYCGSGVTACADLFALHRAGHENARLYAGSWSDWISYHDHPVETGPEE